MLAELAPDTLVSGSLSYAGDSNCAGWVQSLDIEIVGPDSR